MRNFVSYAQNFEDVMLQRAFKEVTAGFYIDIGAQDPVIDSVSLGFYERGWRGVHVEPTPGYAQSLREAREGETVLQAAIGDGGGLMRFFDFPGTGISTGVEELAGRHEAAGFAVRPLEVLCIRLSELLDRYGDRCIHWMKVDVEGMERQVLLSWAPSSVRPWIVVVESTSPMTQELSHQNWEDVIVGLGYRFAYFDGLNRFYVHDSRLELLQAFTTPPNVFDAFSLAGSSSNLLCHRVNQAAALARQAADTAEARWGAANHDWELAHAQLANLEADTARLSAAHEVERQRASASHAAQQIAFDSALRDLQSQREADRVRARDDFDERMRGETADLKSQGDATLARLQAAERSLLEQLEKIGHLHESHAVRQESLVQQLVAAQTLHLEALHATYRSELELTSRLEAERRSNAALQADLADMSRRFESARAPRSLDELLSVPKDSDFVHCSYVAVLHRSADPSGLHNYVVELQRGTDRRTVLAELAGSVEGRAIDHAMPEIAQLVRRAERRRHSFLRRLMRWARSNARR